MNTRQLRTRQPRMVAAGQSLTTTARTLKLPRQTEAAFMEQVATMARLFGWKVFHVRPLRTKHGWRTAVQYDGAGFPDLLMLRGGRQIVAELKRDGGKPTAEQESWLKAFGRVMGIEVYCWKPENWDEIERLLCIGQKLKE